MMNQTLIPTREVGPIKICATDFSDSIVVPLATYETTLWPSTNRGAKVSRQSGGITVTIVDDRMTRSIVLEAPSAEAAVKFAVLIKEGHQAFSEEVAAQSCFTRLLKIHTRIVAKLIYVRLEFSTGDASGHNMVTLAAERIQQCMLASFSSLKYISLSANYCVDKKNSAVNPILGRGKYVIAEITVPREVCKKTMRTSPQQIIDLNIKKNLLGSIISGSVHSANAHVANILLATYLATGQDAANIVEGSQAITYADWSGESLYFSVTIPNLIVGTVGHGKDLDFVRQNLEQLGCTENYKAGANSRRLATIIAATVLCGELSLMAALTHRGELMRAHKAFERRAPQ